MLPQNELRLGNIVCCVDNEPMVVTEIKHDRLVTVTPLVIAEDERYYNTRQNDEMMPIPLTKEWLWKFGFDVKYSETTWTDGKVILIHIDGCTKFLAGSLHVDFHYVHQLQNLYFALTGIDLIGN